MRNRLALLFVAAATAMAACNAVTGAVEIELGDDDGGSGGSGGAGSGGATTGPTVEMAAAEYVGVSAVSLYQGTRRPLMENGVTVTDSTVPIIMGRSALMRVFYFLNPPSAISSMVTAKLTLGDADPIYVDAQLTVESSTEDNLSSTVNFDIPGELMNATGYRVELLQPKDSTTGTNTAAAWPPQGQDPLTITSSGQQLKVVLVPITYGGDGSNRTPDTSPAQLQLYEDLFFGMFPVPEVQISVSPPLQYNGSVSPFGQGWGNLLNATLNFRAQQGAAPDEYYYGIFNGANSFQQWCGGGGCILGLASTQGQQDPDFRAAIGIGYSGPGSTETAAHEVAHSHGRGHAPCGANQGIDPGFPYNNGSTGEWGYDLRNGILHPPTTADFMGYCDPTWISDYNFGALFSQIRLVNNADMAQATSQPKTYDKIVIDADGSTTWGGEAVMARTPSGISTTVTVDDDKQMTGYLYTFDHLEGGILLVPRITGRVSKATFKLAESLYTLSR